MTLFEKIKELYEEKSSLTCNNKGVICLRELRRMHYMRENL